MLQLIRDLSRGIIIGHTLAPSLAFAQSPRDAFSRPYFLNIEKLDEIVLHESKRAITLTTEEQKLYLEAIQAGHSSKDKLGKNPELVESFKVIWIRAELD